MGRRRKYEKLKQQIFTVALPGWLIDRIKNQDEPVSHFVKKAIVEYLKKKRKKVPRKPLP